jgi:hypothetical protein
VAKLVPSTTKTQNPSTRLTIEFEPNEFKAVQEQLLGVPRGADIALSTAINKTLSTERTAIARRLSATMTAKKSSIDKRIRVFRATRDKLSGRINIRGDKGVSLIGFGARQTKRGVTARIFGKSAQYDGAFIARGINRSNSDGPNEAGNKLVFERFGAKRAMSMGRYGPNSIFGKHTRGPRKGQPILRQPISVVYGPSVAETFRKTPGMENQTMTDINANFRKNVQSQVDWLLNRKKSERPK